MGERLSHFFTRQHAYWRVTFLNIKCSKKKYKR